MKPAIKAEVVLAEDPTFEGGSAHTATAVFTNPTEAEFSYTTELYLGPTKVATSGVSLPITIPAGQSVSVTYALVMPVTEGDYDVYLDVWVGTELIEHYKATEVVTIEVSPEIEVGPIIWE